MSLFSRKNKNINRSVNLAYVDGIENYKKGAIVVVNISSEEQCLVIKNKVFNNSIIKIRLDQVTGANVITEKEIIEKSKSTVGRAMIGGVLLGPLGAIIGGISGIGVNQKSKSHYYMVINYKSQNGDIKVISFEIVGSSLHWDDFIKELRSKINNTEVFEKEIYL